MENSAHGIFEVKFNAVPEGILRRTVITGGMQAANSNGNFENSQLQLRSAQTIPPLSNYKGTKQLRTI
jgi:hypothetical protein